MRQDARDEHSSLGKNKVQAEGEGVPKFGRLLMALALAIALIVILVVVSETYYS